jgi:hypothetical protein
MALVMKSDLFLLSPAFCGGRRAQMLLKPGASSNLALRLRASTLTIGEAFSFFSGLYFRGKLAYARAFASPASTLVITPTRGLLSPDTIASVELLREFSEVDIDLDEPRYRKPLERDIARLATDAAAHERVVLLGSVATGKYADILAKTFGPRLHYPASFIGRGDMSRGGLLLRSARAGHELEYVVLDTTVQRRGPRPPKLPPIEVGRTKPVRYLKLAR